MTDRLDYKRKLTLEQVIDEELVCWNIGTLESFSSPYDAYKKLKDLEVSVAKYELTDILNAQEEEIDRYGILLAEQQAKIDRLEELIKVLSA